MLLQCCNPYRRTVGIRQRKRTLGRNQGLYSLLWECSHLYVSVVLLGMGIARRAIYQLVLSSSLRCVSIPENVLRASILTQCPVLEFYNASHFNTTEI